MFEKGYQLFYRYSSREWYDNFQSYIPTSELIDIIKNELPADWKHMRKSNWYSVNSPSSTLIRQGWKIHISATPQNCEEVLRIVTKVCVRYQVSFKFQTDRRLVMFSSGKGWSREASGKFITIYPSNEQQFKEIIDELYIDLTPYVGPYILSDLRYKDSNCVYYRYGGIDGFNLLEVTGDKKYYLEAPDGSLAPDFRTPFWNPPYWVNDPFQHEEQNDSDEEVILKEGRYVINFPISFSVTGGVYNALDLDTGDIVIIKEARPYTGFDEDGLDAVERLKKEFRILKSLNDTGATPQAIDLFYEWEHLFFVQELVEGTDLGTMCINSNPLMRVNKSEESIREYSIKLRNTWCSLANTVNTLHEEGIIQGDLSLKNVLINDDGSNIKIIDFESAILIGKDKTTRICTPGFTSPQRMYNKSQCKEDDYYSLGAIMLGTLFPINGILEQDSRVAKAFIEELGEGLKIPIEIRQLINLCLSENPDNRPSPTKLVDTINQYMLQEKNQEGIQ